MGRCGGSNPDLHACMASQLSTEPPPELLLFGFVFEYDKSFICSFTAFEVLFNDILSLRFLAIVLSYSTPATNTFLVGFHS